MTTIQLRRAWFQVHKWIGLILAILIIPLCLSGAALVWHDALDRALNPDRYAVTGTTLRAPGDYVAAALARLKPGERIATLTMPVGRGPVIVAAAPPMTAEAGPEGDDRRHGGGRGLRHGGVGGGGRGGGGGPPIRTMIYIDPPTARVLAVAASNAGLIRFVHVLHGSLQIPGGWGRSIVGWIGVAMAFSCFTGLWLWWPTVGRWTRGLRWRRHRNLDTNLHHLFGFWIALPLLALSLTGAWIAFPAFFGSLVGEGARGPGGGRQPPAAPLAMPAQPIGAVVARAQASLGGDLTSVQWPTERSADWTVTLGRGQRQRIVKVADDTGVAVAAPARNQGEVARLMRRIHDGDGMGPVWQAIIFLGGILPAILAVTGVVMWWRARRWRATLARRREAPAIG